MSTYTNRLLELVKPSDDEVLKSLISAFFPCQPGALRASWEKRGYAPPSSTALVWQLFEEADFRCSNPDCRSMHRITLDHIDGDIRNSSKDNLRVVCFDCNRGRVGKQITKDLNLVVVKAVFDLVDRNRSFPTDQQVASAIGIASSQLSGARYSIRVMRKFFAEGAVQRLNKSRKIRIQSMT